MPSIEPRPRLPDTYIRKGDEMNRKKPFVLRDSPEISGNLEKEKY